MFRFIIFIFSVLVSSLALTGCFDSSPDEQSVPWSRPADWERSAPGFGSGASGMRRY